VRKLGEGGFGKAYEVIKQGNQNYRKTFKIFGFSDTVKEILNIEDIPIADISASDEPDDSDDDSEEFWLSDEDPEPSPESYLLQDLERIKKIKSDYVAQVDELGRIFLEKKFCVGGFLIREYFDHTLTKELENVGGKFEEAQVIQYLKQISRGMADAWAAGIQHRDLNPNNIGISENGNIKIYDFGLSDYFETHPGLSTVCGIDTRDPRHIEGAKYDPMSDVYSVGAIVYLMVTGESPLEYAGERNVKDKKIRALQNKEAVESYKRKNIQGILERVEECTEQYHPLNRKFLSYFIEKTMCPVDGQAAENKRFGNVETLNRHVQSYVDNVDIIEAEKRKEEVRNNTPEELRGLFDP